MRIVSLDIVAFGKLKDVRINFRQGLNVIQRANGFGKTTVASFIRAMLYGFTYRHSGGATDASHFQPWGGAERFGGSMQLEHNGEVYRIERFFGATARAEKCRVTNENTGKEMQWQMQPGEVLLGLTADSYDRSAYFPQEAVELSSNDNLESRLANLVENSADDYDKIQAKLRDFKKALRYERGVGGRIPDLQQKQSDLERELYDVNVAKRRKTQIENRLRAISSERAELQKKQAANRSESERLRRQLAQASPSDEEKAARMRLSQVEENLSRVPPQAETDISRCEELYAQISQTPEFRVETIARKRWWLAGMAAALALLGAALVALGVAGVIPVAAGAVAGVAAIVAAVASCFFIVSKKERKVSLAEQREKLTAEYFGIAGKYVFEGNDLEATRRALWDMRSRYQSDLRLRETLVNLVKPAADLSVLQQNVDACAQEEKRLSLQSDALLQEEVSLNEESKRLNTDAVQIEDRILDVKEQLAREEYRYRVADTVAQLLVKAKENLSGSYLPRLCRRTTELMKEISATDIEVVSDGKFAISLRENQVTKPMSEFSRGLREIALLCFRVALSELLYDGAVPFLIVDDAFVNYDEYNFLRATNLLKKLSSRAQIIYFTCHDRTGKLTV